MVLLAVANPMTSPLTRETYWFTLIIKEMIKFK